MLKLFSALVLFLSVLAYAVTYQTVRTVYTSTPVTTSAWRQLVASLPYAATSVTVFDSSGQTLKLGFGSSGNEVGVLLIPPGGGKFPLNISKGVAISIIAISSTASTGENDINFFY